MLEEYFRKNKDIFPSNGSQEPSQSKGQQRSQNQKQPIAHSQMMEQQDRQQRASGHQKTQVAEQNRPSANKWVEHDFQNQAYQQQQSYQRGMNQSRSVEPMKTGYVDNSNKQREPQMNQMHNTRIEMQGADMRKEAYRIKKKGTGSPPGEMRDFPRKMVNETQFARNQLNMGINERQNISPTKGSYNEMQVDDGEAHFSDEEDPNRMRASGPNLNGQFMPGPNPIQMGTMQKQQMGQYYNFQPSQQMQPNPLQQQQYPQRFQQFSQQTPLQQGQNPQQMPGPIPQQYPQQLGGQIQPTPYRQPIYPEINHPEITQRQQQQQQPSSMNWEGYDRKHALEHPRSEDSRLGQSNRGFDPKTLQIVDLVNRTQQKIQGTNVHSPATEPQSRHGHHGSAGKGGHHPHHQSNHPLHLQRESSAKHPKEPVAVFRIILNKLKHDLTNYWEDRYRKNRLIDQLHITTLSQYSSNSFSCV